MKPAIVTTTINKPTEAILRYIDIAKANGMNIYIVGDQKTPHDEYLALAQDFGHVAYLTPQAQERKYKQLSDLIGWNCIQRRNIGFIEAYNHGADWIATIDDDNIPYKNWGEFEETDLIFFETLSEVFDPLSPHQYNELWHRGFPIQLLHNKNRVKAIEEKKQTQRTIAIANLWDGAPDIDAMARITFNDPLVQYNHKFEYYSDKPAPFNSQNTWLHRDAFPTYFLFPGIGRMDDIWASYLLQATFPDRKVVFGPSTVYQERNPHDLTKDLVAEYIGYEHTLEFVRAKTEVKHLLPEKSWQAYEQYRKEFKNANKTA